MQVRPSDGERGFALVLALLALTLLTVLGLTLAATTSMEVQAAANHRWDRQAYYNAEGGLEAGRAALRSMSWATILPSPRPYGWFLGDSVPPPTASFTTAKRNFENGGCDKLGAGAGYGAVLDDGSGPWEYRSRIFGRDLRGTVTLWVRRPIVQYDDGTLADDGDSDVLILTAEGLAPFTTAAAAAAAPAHAARRVLEMQLRRRPRGIGWDVVVEKSRPGSTACS